jgi:hypothetical protein
MIPITTNSKDVALYIERLKKLTLPDIARLFQMAQYKCMQCSAVDHEIEKCDMAKLLRYLGEECCYIATGDGLYMLKVRAEALELILNGDGII